MKNAQSAVQWNCSIREKHVVFCVGRKCGGSWFMETLFKL